MDCFQLHRRQFIATTTLGSIAVLDPRNIQRDANALFEKKDRRQKELCLVDVLRLQFWANGVVEKLSALDISDELSKSLYLEARLGSKVMVAETKKISGGATANVFMLKSLHIRDSLEDLTFYADRGSKRQMAQCRDDLIEALASIVEFDGLETTQDPSPRSSLTLKMYNAQKCVYVQRMLAERVVPLVEEILRLFGPDAKAESLLFIREYYPSEI